MFTFNLSRSITTSLMINMQKILREHISQSVESFIYVFATKRNYGRERKGKGGSRHPYRSRPIWRHMSIGILTLRKFAQRSILYFPFNITRTRIWKVTSIYRMGEKMCPYKASCIKLCKRSECAERPKVANDF